MFTVRKKFRIEMAHQLATAVTAACHETIHGHSYVIEVFISSKELDKDDMVLDFGGMGAIKEIVFEYDHALCIPIALPRPYINALLKYNKKCLVFARNPTAEVLAEVLMDRIRALLTGKSHWVSKIRVHETDTGYAEVTKGGDGEWL